MTRVRSAGGIGEIRLISCLGVDLELSHLRHFLAHYLQLGISPANVHILLNTADAGSANLGAAEAILAQAGAAPPRRWIGPYTSDAMWQQRRQLQRDVAGAGDWIVNADMDEHHRYPAPVSEVARYCAAKGYNGVQGFLIDRLALEGRLCAVADRPALSAQFPLRAEVDLAILGAGDHHGVDSTVKLMLHRGDVLPSRGGHNPWAEGAAPRYLAGQRLARCAGATDPAYRFAYPFRVDHYKWTATRLDTLKRRLAAPGVSPAGREAGDKVTRYLAQHGRVRLQDVAVADEAAPAARPGWKLLALRQRLRARAGDIGRRLRARLA